MSLFSDFGSLSTASHASQGFSSPSGHQRSASASSGDDSFTMECGGGSGKTVSTERFERQMRHLQRSGDSSLATQHRSGEDEEEWDIISKKIDSCVRLDTQFFEYPTQEIFSSPPGSGNVIDDDELVGTKVFLGGMRFEVVQMGRHMVSWLLEAGCGVKLPFGRILIHRKSRNGKPAAPTGCASVYVANEEDVTRLISMNQRIFCGVRGLHVASTPEQMAELIRSKSILDIVDGRVRGPTHPMIIEKAYNHPPPTPSPVSFAASATPPNGSFSSAQLTSSFGGKGSDSPVPPPLLPDGSVPPVYHKYEGDSKSQCPLDVVPVLKQPLELFVGGLCYEATRTFVSWMFKLIDIPLHPQNVTLYVDPQTGVKRGCAQVRIEEADFPKASAYTRRMLCDACGVYIAESPQGIVAVQQSKERVDHSVRGPTHAVVIERRRNTGRAGGGGVGVGVGGGAVAATGLPGMGIPGKSAPPPPPPMGGGGGLMAPPPPPPPMQLVQMPGGQYVMLVTGAAPGTVPPSGAFVSVFNGTGVPPATTDSLSSPPLPPFSVSATAHFPPPSYHRTGQGSGNSNAMPVSAMAASTSPTTAGR